MAEKEDEALDEVCAFRPSYDPTLNTYTETQVSALVLNWQDRGRRDPQAGCQRDPSIHRSIDRDGLGSDRYATLLSTMTHR